MKRFASFVLGCIAVFCLMIATERKALAYIDPGSGLLAIQSAAAAVGSVAYFCRRKIRALFGGAKTDETETATVVEKKPETRKAA